MVVLKDLENMQYREIAEALQQSIGTVMSRLFYGRKKLQSILKPFYDQSYKTRHIVDAADPLKVSGLASECSQADSRQKPTHRSAW